MCFLMRWMRLYLQLVCPADEYWASLVAQMDEYYLLLKRLNVSSIPSFGFYDVSCEKHCLHIM